MKNVIKVLIIAMSLSGCVHNRWQDDKTGDDYLDSTYSSQKLLISDFMYLESYQKLADQDVYSNYDNLLKEREHGLQLLSQEPSIGFRETLEEKIDRSSEYFIQQQDWKQAYQNLMLYNPTLTYNKKIGHRLILSAIMLGYYPLAIDQLQLALKESRQLNDQKDLLQTLAQVYYLNSDYEPALKLVSHLKSEYEYDVSAHYTFMLGFKMNNYALMNAGLEQLDESSPTYQQLAVLRIHHDFETGKKSEALKQMNDLFAKNAADIELGLNYASLLIQDQKWIQAQDVLNKLPQSLSAQSRTDFMKAFIYLKLGENKNFRESVQRLPSSVESQKKFNQVLLGQGTFLENYVQFFSLRYQDLSGMSAFEDQKMKDHAANKIFSLLNQLETTNADNFRVDTTNLSEPHRLPSSLEFQP